MLAGKGSLPEFEKFLVKFEEAKQEVEAEEDELEYLPDGSPGPAYWKPMPINPNQGIEIGDPLDERWQRVNKIAKAQWMAALKGINVQYTEGRYDGSRGTGGPGSQNPDEG